MAAPTTAWYHDCGGEGHPLVLLHGYTGDRNTIGFRQGTFGWLLQRSTAPRFRVIFVESRGCGAAGDSPGPFTIAQQAQDVLAIADQLGLERFSFLGHSMGGGVGFELASTSPHRLVRLVLVAPIPSNGVGRDRSPVLEHRGQNPHPLACQGYAGVPSWDFCFEAGQILREDRPSTLAGVADAGVAGADGSSPTDLRDRDSIAWLRERSSTMVAVSDEYWSASWLSMCAFDRRNDLKDVTVPTLLVAGATDGLLQSNLKDAAAMADCVLGVLPAAGHDVPHDDPAGLARAVFDFFDGRAISPRQAGRAVAERLKQRGKWPAPKL